MGFRIVVLPICLVACLMLSAAPGASGGTPLTTELVIGGLNRPIFFTHANDDFERMFIVEQRGVIKLLKNGVLQGFPFLDIDSKVPLVSNFSERGLLGLAFHPDYPETDLFYVNYNNLGGATIIAQYSLVNEDRANVSSEVILMVIAQPQTNHNGGWIAFGPDGYLYIATGDGGNANDSGPGHSAGGNAQDITNNPLGKMLRIDVNGDDFPGDPNKNYAIPPDNPFVGITGDDEIWAYGLRNPWRNSFDRETGDLYIGDVGQNAWEEIDFQPASSTGGENYGWRCMEGDHCTGLSGCTCNAVTLVDPIHEYFHSCATGGFSLTGGYVYRGCAIPDLGGTYFLADYVCSNLWSFRYDGVNMTDFTNRKAELDPPGSPSILSISSFGEDAYGEIYIVERGGTTTGEIWKIVPNTPGPVEDCNENGTEDACDILDGSSNDNDGNGVPDECETPFAIVSSDPPNDAIDARQPSNPDGSDPAGWNAVTVTFNGDATGISAASFTISIDPPGATPIIDNVTTDGNSATIEFTDTIPLVAWTIVTHNDSGSSVRIGNLPADVNNDKLSNASDILILIDALNDVGLPLAPYQSDIDRSGATNASDVLRTIDLLNGAGVYDVFNGAGLPD